MNFEWALHLIIQYRYWALFPLACFEGPLVALIVGFLASLGYFDLLPAYIIMLFGDIIPDSFYYYLGRFGKRTSLIKRYGIKIGIRDEHAEHIARLWRDHPLRTMWTGKLAYGLAIPFLISAGLVGMPFKRFIAFAIPVTLFQYGILMILGYYFGNSLGVIARSFTGIGIAIGVLLVATIIYYAFRFVMRDKVLREQNRD